MSESKKKATLVEDEIQTERPVGRRSALGILGVGVVGAVAATGLLAGAQRAEAQVTDSDTGGNADSAGHGRTGQTDRDSGPDGDRAGHGVCAQRGHTDSDSGSGADSGGHGRGPCH